jgi:NAD(P)-dependent dehydrogenase (short-subunit alcohol dehydrogenase family)
MIAADLSGGTPVITGGASAIGPATVEPFARCGARVALSSSTADGPSDDAGEQGETVPRTSQAGRTP